ncbi:MAG TPA: bifunctional nuclease family protein [Acidimicrobiales bacterium]|nr:bifunctional nuclease family protein [Acidimicrobiales bacterium]
MTEADTGMITEGEEQGTAEPDPGAAFDRSPMRLVELRGIEVQLPSTNPTLVFDEVDPPRRELRITIGQTEGIAIAYALRRIDTPKPLTHDLFRSVLEAFGVSVDVVRITAVSGTSFSAELVLTGRTGTRVVECRPSDALALALRQPVPVPIMVAPDVMDQVGAVEL